MKKLNLPKLDKSSSASSSLGKNKNLSIAIVAYIVACYSVWTLYIFFLKDLIFDFIGNKVIESIVSSFFIRYLIWVVPAFILIKHFEKDMYISLKESFTTRVKLKDLMIIVTLSIILSIACILYVPLTYNGNIGLNFNIGATAIVSLIFVGVGEEIPFRCWLLNATLKDDNQFAAILINAILFLAVHFPIWIKDDLFMSNLKYMGFFIVLIMSLSYSWSYVKSKNIIVTIFLHTFYDFLVYVISIV